MDQHFFMQRFFANATYIIPWRYNSRCIRPVRRQRHTGLCYACTIVDCIYCHDFNVDGWAEELSVQQFYDDFNRLTNEEPEEPGRPGGPEDPGARSSGGSILNAIGYARTHGLCSERDVPWLDGEPGNLPDGFRHFNRRRIAGYERLHCLQSRESLHDGSALYCVVYLTPSMTRCLTRQSEEICRHSEVDLPVDRRIETHAMVCIGYGRHFWVVKNSWEPKLVSMDSQNSSKSCCCHV